MCNVLSHHSSLKPDALQVTNPLDLICSSKNQQQTPKARDFAPFMSALRLEYPVTPTNILIIIIIIIINNHNNHVQLVFSSNMAQQQLPFELSRHYDSRRVQKHLQTNEHTMQNYSRINSRM